MPKLRLDKIISDSGLFSRSEAAALIKQGRVSVNFIVLRNNSEKADPDSDKIHVDGKLLEYSKFHYLMMNKPQGYVSATRDRAERTVMELLDDRYSKLGLFPAGRLDKDTEGFLLLTNDGDFAHLITSPNGKVYKRYFMQIDGKIDDNDIKAIAAGITLGDGTKCQPAILELTPQGVFISIREGKYHQVKRMMAALGKPVKYLKRVAIGALVLDEGLALGEYKDIRGEIGEILRPGESR